ncbi:hypothetical protein C474_11501 [Halogeometricum pallidum JCM 14848]|uniref:Uncharacterized protein n=1 Tax=Halogeometricum pallidum JCM 14848 TaxID=1227487 RepID=M0D4R0_HALPD|nr:hypothetical protein [Halogeometricum pallidum]ELZ30435.1 hypothetical protein C474_11501 [Halogeometricum pallidum JCM 14848]
MFDRTSLLSGAVVRLSFSRSNLRESRSRWSLLHVLLVAGGAQFGVQMNFPIPSSLTTAIWFLVLGVGWAALLVGVQMSRENASSGSDPTAVTTD